MNATANDRAGQRFRFVILEHDHPFLHWDLLMESGDVLKSWRLLKAVEPGSWIPAEAIADHRLHYLDYEGPVSKDRGCVSRVAAGRFEVAAGDQIHTKTFSLYDCDFASSATVRESSDGPEWCFE